MLQCAFLFIRNGLFVLSYKHAFHAGNHADVIKHMCWLGVINYLKKKEKPFTLFDTHSGAGCYPLNSEQTQKNREYESGIDPLANVQPNAELLKMYLDAMDFYWQQPQYPGSPLIATRALRPQDSAHYMELHPNEADILNDVIRGVGMGNAHVHHRDGLEGLIAMTPPNPNRGAVLIDPPYERFDEYREVKEAVTKLFRRWQNAQLVLWYPLLSARADKKSGASEDMIEALAGMSKTAFSAELHIDKKENDTGMYGSGVLVMNPPWQLDVQLDAALQEVCGHLGPNAISKIRWLKQESDQ